MSHSPLVALQDISKSFFGVSALSDVSLDVAPGEVLALVGENGAGKSTLMKILSGGYLPDHGKIIIDGVAHTRLTPVQALELGIAIIHQENLLAPTMTVLENIYAGHELTRGFLMDYKAMRKGAEEELRILDLQLDLNRCVEQLSAAEQQYVKILKAMMFRPRLLIMDEPTSIDTESADIKLENVRFMTY